MNRVAQAMCVALVLAGLPRSAWASGEKATEAEDAKYAALEADSPEAASFEGGQLFGEAGLAILVVLVVILVLYFLIENESAYAMEPAAESGLDLRPPLFR